MRKYLLLVILTITSLSLFSQDFSNKGKDFWVGYGYHAVMVGGNQQEMVLYFATDQVTNITISIPGTGYTQNITTGAAPTVTTSSPIPKGGLGDARLLTEGTSAKGIHITSDKPMVAYAHIYNSSVSGACILFPTPTLGKEYYSVNYTNISNSANANCWFYVVATDPGTTTVEITPSAPTVGGWSAGTTYTVVLNQGEIYNVMATFDNAALKGGDLTGSLVKSISSGSGGCKRIGVFSGSGRISITCNGASSSSDNYMVQTFPKSAWGKKYLTAPTAGNMSNNIYRVCVQDPTTVVKINGLTTLLPLINNFYYELPATNQPQMIEADKPIVVAQYVSSQGACSNGNPGDPEVIYLSSVEQNIDKVSWNATPNFAINQQFFNVIIPNKGTGISSFKLFDQANNIIPTSPFVVHPQDNNYSYLRQTLPGAGVYRIQSDSGFNAIAYGFGSAESYGYNAGTNIKDLYQQMGVATQYGIEPGNNICTGTTFKFKMSLPYPADSIFWDLTVLPASTTPAPAKIMLYPPPDSIIVVNGKNIYWYSLPSQYDVPVAGTYNIPIIAYNSSNPNGCGVEQELEFVLNVVTPPTAAFNITTIGGCFAEPFKFADNTTGSTHPTYLWWWDFGDPASGALNNSTAELPQHTFTAPGTYTIRFSSITTPGCIADTIDYLITVPELPEATITGNATVCINSAAVPITFTGSKGTAPYDFSYTVDNGGGPGPVQVVSSVGTTATILHNPTVAGTYIYTLTKVNNKGSGLCVTNYPVAVGTQITVVVKPLPDAAIAGGTTVCLNAPQPPVTFTGSGGTAQYTVNYTINGTPQTPLTTTGVGTITLNAPTNVAGTFIYDVTSIAEGSPQSCARTYAPGAIRTTVIVKPLPTASMVRSTAAVCLNAPSPTITFTGTTGTAPYTFGYTIDNGGGPGPVQFVSSISPSSTYVLNVPTTTAGTFTYTLVSVQEGSANLCVTNGINTTTTVAVNPIPDAAIAGAITVCQNATMPQVTLTGSGGTAPYRFNYTINSVPQPVAISDGAGIALLNVPTGTPGPFVYEITSVTDNLVTACTRTFAAGTHTTTVNVKALPTASISGTTEVCLNATMPQITFNGNGGTAPYTFSYTINDGSGPGPVQTVSSGAASTITLNVPTTVAGTFTYTLVSVQEGSANSCVRPNINTTATVKVNPLPTASIAASAPEVCKNTPLSITFTGANGTPNYKFTYTINTVLQPVITSVGNSITIPVSTVTAGIFTYQLVSVSDGTITACSQPQTSSVSVTVNELPTPDFTFSAPNCQNKSITFTDASIANSGTLASWDWTFGDATSGTGTPVTHTYATAGVKNVVLLVKNSKGCESTINHTVTVSENPAADFTVPEACITDNVNFPDISTAPAGNPLVKWEWNFDDPGSGASNTQVYTTPGPGTHIFSTTGIHNVSLTVTTSTGCTHTTLHPIDINGVPTSSYNLSNTTNQCSSDTVFLTNTSTITYGNIIKQEIYWDNIGAPGTFVNEDNPAVGNVYKHKYPTLQTTKTYEIKVRSYSGLTCFDDEIRTLTVYATPLVQFNNMPDVCYDAAPFQITQASEIGGVPGTPSYSGPGVTSTGIFTPALAGIGTHIIKYTFTATAGGCIDTLSKTIRVRDTASANFTPAAIRCEKSAIQFNSTSSTIPAGEGSITGWNWNFGDPGSGANNTSNAPNPAHTYANAGTYFVTLIVSTSNGCFSTPRVIQVNVDPLPAPSFGFDKPSYCIPNAIVTFSNASTIPSGSAMTYTWDFGDLSTGTGPTPSHHYTSVGPFNVTLTATSAENCVNTITIPLTTIHPQPKADFATSKPAVCIGEAVTFTDLSDGKDGIINQWNWSFGDAQTAIINPVTHLYATAQDYNVTLFTVNSQGCNSDTITRVFTVDPFPVVNAGPDRFLLEGGQITLEPTVTGTNLSYLWTPNVSMSNNRVENPVIRNLTGDITYRLTVTAKGGCSASDEVFVKLLRAPKIPNTFTPNNDGINDTWRIDYLNTYPNNRVQIFTRTGQKVFESRGYNKPWDGTLNGKPLPIDTYYYIIEPNNGRDPITGYVTILK